MLRKRGFTLIELLVVIAIIAILATLVIAQLSNAQFKAKYAKGENDLGAMAKTVDIYRRDMRAGGQAIPIMTTGTYTECRGGCLVKGIAAFSELTSTAPSATCTVQTSNSLTLQPNPNPNAYVDGGGCNFTKVFSGTETFDSAGGTSSYGLAVTAAQKGWKYQYGTVGLLFGQTYRTIPSTPNCYILRMSQVGGYNDVVPRWVSYKNGERQVSTLLANGSYSNAVDCQSNEGLLD